MDLYLLPLNYSPMAVCLIPSLPRFLMFAWVLCSRGCLFFHGGTRGIPFCYQALAVLPCSVPRIFQVAPPLPALPRRVAEYPEASRAGTAVDGAPRQQAFFFVGAKWCSEEDGECDSCLFMEGRETCCGILTGQKAARFVVARGEQI